MMDPRDAAGDAFAARQDRRLVGRLLAGEEAAFEELCDAHLERLYRFALGRVGGDEDAAREMAQETLVTAFSKLDTFRGDSTLFTWLCGICHFAVQNHRRRRGRAGEVALEDETSGVRATVAALATGEDVVGELERRDVRRQVHEALDRLPPHYARALEWKYLEGLPVDEIARRLDVGLKAAESVLSRARAAFREVFPADGDAARAARRTA